MCGVIVVGDVSGGCGVLVFRCALGLGEYVFVLWGVLPISLCFVGVGVLSRVGCVCCVCWGCSAVGVCRLYAG